MLGPGRFHPRHWSKFARLPQKRPRLQQLSFFLNRVSMRWQSPDRVSICPKTNVLSVICQIVECLTLNCLFFSVETLYETKLRLRHPMRENGSLVTSSRRQISCRVTSLELISIPLQLTSYHGNIYNIVRVHRITTSNTYEDFIIYSETL